MQVPPFQTIPTSTIPNVGGLIGNETEATTFAETDRWEKKYVPSIVKKLSSSVIIQGANPTVVCVGGETTEFTFIALSDKPVDNNGAGDAYVGAPRVFIVRQTEGSQEADPTTVFVGGEAGEYPFVSVQKEKHADTNGSVCDHMGGFLSVFAQVYSARGHRPTVVVRLPSKTQFQRVDIIEFTELFLVLGGLT